MHNFVKSTPSTTLMPGTKKRYNGHRATISPWLAMQLKPPMPINTTSWSMRLEDERWGHLNLYGHLDDVPGATRVVVVVHGLGGCSDALYCKALAVEAQRRGMACLRISCRGAARRGEDLHHAGLYEDLAAVLEHPSLSRFEGMILVGFSLGGHMSLRLSGARCIDRLDAVLACCPPIDLTEVTRHLDARRRWIYRQHVLRGLHELYEPLVQRRRHPTPLERMKRVRTLREWDAVATVARFGFHNVAHYYETQSVLNNVMAVHQPTFIVASPHDPMIPGGGLHKLMARKIDGLSVLQVPGGGHAFFSTKTNLPGFRPEDHVLGQSLDWVLASL